jgi:IS605 OrfB family transposase
MGNLVKTCKIKLFLIEKDQEKRNNLYNLLTKMSYEARNIRHDTLKRSILFNYLNTTNPHAIDLTIGKRVNKKGKKHTYSTFLTATRESSKYLTETQASWIQTEVETKFKNELFEYNTGKIDYPNFKDLSILVKSKESEIQVQDGEYVFYPSELRKKGYIFGFTGIEKDKSVKNIVDKILNNDYGLSDSRIIKKDKFWYLYLCYNFSPNLKSLDKDIICGIDLGWKIPAYCGLKNELDRKAIGDSIEIQKFRTQIKNRRRRLQRKTTTKGGHGRKRKFDCLDSLMEKESNFVKTYNHTMSKQIIDFCMKNNAGTIHLEALTSEVKKNAFLTAYWSYYQLQQMIEYKAKEIGVIVKYINPAYTSQKCSKCGSIDKDNRKDQAHFKCTKCGYESNADYNASINIANSKLFIKKGKLEEEEEKINENTYISNDILLFSQQNGEGVSKNEAQLVFANPTH